MSAIHQYRCESCKLVVDAKYNGEHYLVPEHWVEMKHPDQQYAVGHLCGECCTMTLHVPLRIHFAKYLERHFK